MNEIENAFTLDYKTIIIGVFVILFVIKQVVEILAYYKKKLRVKTGVQEDKEELNNRIAVLEKHDNWQYGEICKISKCLEEIKAQLLDKEISDIRWEILDFASSLSNGKFFSKEQFDHVISIHGRYKKILSENGLTNGLVDSSMDVINEKYKEFMKTGFKMDCAKEFHSPDGQLEDE